MKTNAEKLVKQSVQGFIKPLAFTGYRLDTEGKPHVVPATGGITYNVKVGDSAFGLAGDHIEPGVSVYHPDPKYSAGLNVFSCIGNRARVMTGDAKGSVGFVTGTHGGAEHVLIYFDEDTLYQLNLDDKILIETLGQGFELNDYPDVKMMNLDPNLFEKMGIEERDGKLIVPVTCKVPQNMMGSGVGSSFNHKGDYDIMTSDKEAVKATGVDKLKFGDIVLLENSDNTYGLGAMLPGAVSIGVIIHSDCIKAGHGPGVTILMSSKTPCIEGKIDPNANIANYMGI
ncbi:MAG: hypothetical protein PWQ12_683 [Clostridiales bacterium]|nr:hypothetical protein [Clostridiales bacterium]